VKFVGTDLQRLSDSQSAWQGDLAGLCFELDGGGTAIPNAMAADLPSLPFSGTIQQWTIVGDVSGSVVVDIQRCTYANFPTYSSIAGTAKPTLSSAQKAQNTTLSGWGSTAISQGDMMRAVTSGAATSITRLSVMLWVKRTS
jgi:hypothetical protein